VEQGTEPLEIHVRHLMDYGLTSYEARAYLALLRRETFTAAELATEAQVPRQRIYDTVANLIARGMARDEPGTIARYSARDPEGVFAQLQATKQRELDQLSAHAAEILSEMTHVWQDGQRETAPLDYVQVLRDPLRIEAASIDMFESAQHSISQLCKPPYVLPGNEVPLAAATRVGASGGTVRGIYEDAQLSNDVLLDEARDFGGAGEQARTLPSLPVKMAVIDGRRGFIALPDPIAGHESVTVLMIDHPAYGTLLELAFEQLWQQSQPVEFGSSGADA